jgi:hypothetical protein
LLERRFWPEPEATEADIALDEAARQVRALRAIQNNKFQRFACLNGGTLSIFEKGKFNPLVSAAHSESWSGDDCVMLDAVGLFLRMRS